ncbi:MAG: hypothetical protein JSR58_03370 [Verrucomicrobia bacterium]|nr:hypothetical protein [Verrucomicrobiota bacterium]
MGSYGKEIRKQYGLELTKVGGRMMIDIEVFDIGFARKEKATIDEARQLATKITEGFIQKINSDEEIRPYLHDFPITRKNVNIHIRFDKSKNEPKGSPFAYYVTVANNKIYYDAYDNSDPSNGQIVDFVQEPYDQALKIVQETSR